MALHLTPVQPAPPSQPLPDPQFRFFADLRVEVGLPQQVGQTAHGLRRLIPITGGTATGDGWSARVLPGGADFQIVVSDTCADLDARYLLQLDNGEHVFVQNRALRRGSVEDIAKLVRGEPVDPAAIYFRCVPTFEVSHPSLAWLTESVFVGTGARFPDRVEISVYRLA